MPAQEPSDFKAPASLLRNCWPKGGCRSEVPCLWLEVSQTIVSRMISGARPVDAQMAIKLSDVLGEPPERFLMLQKSIDFSEGGVSHAPRSDTIREGNALREPTYKRNDQAWMVEGRKNKDVEGVAKRELKKFLQAYTSLTRLKSCRMPLAKPW